MLYIGLDLTASSQKPTACAVVDDSLSPISLGFLHTDANIMEHARRIQPAVVAIDAPLFLPLGFCCLEEACPCAQRLPGKGFPPKSSAAGRAFLRRATVGLFAGPSPTGRRLTHDECDALLAAYTAYLYYRGQTEAVGDPEEGVLHVPR